MQQELDTLKWLRKEKEMALKKGNYKKYQKYHEKIINHQLHMDKFLKEIK